MTTARLRSLLFIAPAVILCAFALLCAVLTVAHPEMFATPEPRP